MIVLAAVGVIALITSGVFVIFLILRWPSHDADLRRMKIELELHHGKGGPS